MSLTRTYLDAERDVVPPTQAVWMVERENDAQGKVVRETWHKIVSYQSPTTPAPGPVPPPRPPAPPTPPAAAPSRGVFIAAATLLLAASLLLLAGAPTWLAVGVLLAGCVVVAGALQRR